MAADAVATDVDMVEVRRNPADRAVTVIAGITAGNMRIVLTRGDHAVVA